MAEVQKGSQKPDDWDEQLRRRLHALPAKEVLDREASRNPLTRAERAVLSEAGRLLGAGESLESIGRRVRAEHTGEKTTEGVTPEQAGVIVDSIMIDTAYLTTHLPYDAVALMLIGSRDLKELNRVTGYVHHRAGYTQDGRAAHSMEEVSLSALEYMGEYRLSGKVGRGVKVGLAAAAAAAVIGTALFWRGGEKPPEAPPAEVRMEAPEVAPPTGLEAPKPEQEMDPKDKAYLDGQAETLGAEFSRTFPASRYGYADILRSADTRIFRAKDGPFKGLIVFDTGRHFKPAEGGASIIGDNPSDCSERAFAAVPLLEARLGGGLKAVIAEPVTLMRRLGGEDSMQEHWIDVAELEVNGKRYAMYFDLTPLDRTAGPRLAVADTADLDAGLVVEKGKPEFQSNSLAAMFNSTKRVLPLSKGYQPMRAIDAGGGERIMVDAGMTETEADISFRFNAARFRPGDSDKAPEFGEDYWATVTVQKAGLKGVQDALKGSKPEQVLNVMNAAGAKVEASPTKGLTQELRDAVVGNIDLLHHLAAKTSLE
jgi:hypothetical protein